MMRMLRLKQYSLRTQLIFLILLVSTLSLTVAGVTLFVTELQRSKILLTEELTSLASLLADRSSAALLFDDEKMATENLTSLSHLDHIASACMFDKTANEFAKHENPSVAPTVCKAQLPLTDSFSRAEDGAVHVQMPVYTANNVVGAVQIHSTAKILLDRLRAQIISLLIALGGALFLSAVLTLRLQRIFLQPLAQVSEVATDIVNSSNFSLRAPDLGKHELGELANAFNLMLSTIEIQNAELAESEAYTRTLFYNSPIAQLIVDPISLTFIDCNQAAASIHGYGSHKDLIGKSLLVVMAPFQNSGIDTATFIKETKDQLVTQGLKQAELRYRRADGVLWDGMVCATTLTLKGRKLTHLSVQDFTARKAAETALRNSQKSLNEAQRIAHVGSWELDLVDNVLTWSDEVFRIFELDPAHFSATYDAFLVAAHPHDRDAVNAAYTRSLETREPYEITHRLLMPDGRIKQVHERCETLYDDTGKALRSIGMVQDVTERKQAEAELEQHRHHLEELVAERTQQLEQARDAAEAANRAKSIFIANMSHELRTPLNAILGFSQLMVRETGIPPHQHNNLTTINRAGEHLLAIINDVLDLSKIEAGKVELKPEAFDLARMLQDLAEMFRVRAQGKELKFRFELQDIPEGYSKTDPGKLRQVLINLLGNALKFTRQGAITLRAACLPLGEGKYPTGFANRSDLLLRVVIEDTGIGIPNEAIARIFRPFVQATSPDQAEHQGTGLGLAISRSFIELMGGTIEAASTPGQGSVFRFEIPLQVGVQPAPAPEPSREVLSLAAGEPEWRILVVDDAADNRALLTAMLGQVGFAVREACNGAQAVELFQTWSPHFIWLDMRMPVMDGFEAARRIRALPGGGAVKIAAITASVFIEEQEPMLAAGCDQVVIKPCKPHEIFRALEAALGLHYVYAQPQDSPPEPHAKRLHAEDLVQLPLDLLKILLDAVLRLDTELVAQVTQRIHQQQPVVAAAIQALAKEYRYDLLMTLCEQALKDVAQPAASPQNLS